MNVHVAFDRHRGRYKPSREARATFQAALKTERFYVRQLRKIADQVGTYIGTMWEYDIKSTLEIYSLLARYAQMIAPWAEAVTRRMQTEIAARNLIQWDDYMKTLGVELQKEVRTAPIGERMRQLLNEQVGLITSLPKKEAKRVHELTLKGLTSGERYEVVRAKIIGPLEKVHPKWTDSQIHNRATLIARTEVSRTASILTQARAEHLGSTTYVWRTARDAIVRPSHRELEGTVHKWTEPPLCDLPDYHAHPGQIFNCRCHAAPIFPL